MKRACFSLAMVALGAVLAISPLNAQTCSIGGHNETSENFNPGDWSIPNGSPGTVPAGVTGSHLLISEVAPRGFGVAAGSDSSEYIEIYNPTTRPVRLDNKYISDEIGYYNVVNGPYTVTAANINDWVFRFPAGLALLPGRTLILCVTKAGFAAMGATPGPAQYFLEMKDSNGSAADDMILMTSNSSIPASGGTLTNPSNTNGEWVVLFCWNGVSDRVCDIDYASWGANSASNPKMDKTGIAIDGPDAGAATSAFNADTPAAAQSNLGNGSVLTKPGTYQRIGGENSEVAFNGNGCLGLLTPTISWLPTTGATGDPNVRFQVRWTNQDDDAGSGPVNGTLNSQHFGVFLPDYGQIGSFNVPPLAPSSFFDVFIEIPLNQLPPPPDKHVGGGPGPQAVLGSYVESTRGRGGPRITNDCPPDTNWAGNVDLIWSGPGGNGQVNKHYSDIMVCAGGAPSYIHLRFNNCTGPMPWSVVGICPGFSSTLVNEDLTPAPNPVPPGWTGYICINAAAVVPSGTTCCFGIVFQCQGVSSTIDICALACNCQTVPPTLGSVTWTVNGGIVTFQQHWQNNNSSPSDPVSGTMNSQPLGVFLADFGPIGQFNIPPIQPNSFFDVFIDIPLSALPPNPPIELPGGGPPPGSPCEPTEHWHGNVNIDWNGQGGSGQVFKHFADVPVCPGAGPTYLFVETDCNNTTGSPWNITGVCPGFSVTLVNTDNTPAPNPVPPGWIGKICVQATAATPSGLTCCFAIHFLCNGVVGTIDVCAKTCDWGPKKPVLAATNWTRVGSNVRFHMLWRNPNSTPSDPVSGTMNSQPFGVFAPDFGHIGQFDVPPMAPNSFFDVFLEVPLSDLPPEPQEILPGGGPGPGSPCPQDTSWSGNVDIQWAGPGGAGIVGRHFTSLLVRPGTGSSHIHALMFCNSALGSSWTIAGLCPGWSATLLNEDFTPAPNPVPPNWTGWISVAAANSVPPGASCCFTVTFVCDGQPGVIDVCAEACQWPNSGVSNRTGAEFGIYSTAPNPASTEMSIAFAMPKAGAAKLEVFNLTGQRVRTLFSGQANAGVNSVRWDARGENGRTLAAGAYFVTLKAGERVSTKKIVLFH